MMKGERIMHDHKPHLQDAHGSERPEIRGSASVRTPKNALSVNAEP